MLNVKKTTISSNIEDILAVDMTICLHYLYIYWLLFHKKETLRQKYAINISWSFCHHTELKF